MKDETETIETHPESLAAWKRHAAALDGAAEMLWTVVANAGGGDWTTQTQEWQDAAAQWRDHYFKIAAEAAE